ncbi:zinc ribbon domain-containing protein [Propioniciclava soli]|uniref:C4-type zinc ribbon domain-containing protein n=1 Tax=Propioniciclava soli TaxID=2775081 RepID=A0ABZ3C4S8_9ACTN|nr:C4-type zinc ribbon domain-containing protein [Propioniciclava soli]
MKAAPELQRRLLDLQAVDTALAQVEHRRRTLPETATAQQLHARRSALAEKVVEADTRVADLSAEATKAENDIVPVRERRERNQQRVDAGQVGDPKALSAMVDEIAHLGRRIGDLEDRQLEAMEALDEAVAARDRIAGDKTAVEQELRGVLEARKAALAELDAEASGHTAERDALAATLPADLLALYGRIAEKSGGVGAALLQRGRCRGCQLEATSADMVRYRGAPADEVLRCEECNRILVRTAESGL